MQVLETAVAKIGEETGLIAIEIGIEVIGEVEDTKETLCVSLGSCGHYNRSEGYRGGRQRSVFVD